MKETGVGELVRQAKGEDRSLREYGNPEPVQGFL